MDSDVEPKGGLLMTAKGLGDCAKGDPARKAGGEGVAVAYDLAADENRARDRLIDALDIGADGLSCRSSGPPVGRPRSFGAVVAQIAVAQRGEAVQMTEQSMPGCRVAAATVPGDDDRGHRKSRFIVERRNRPTLRWLAARAQGATFR